MLRAIRNILHGPQGGTWKNSKDSSPLVTTAFGLLLALLLVFGFAPNLLTFVTVGSTQALGKELFSSVNGFILPFEIVSILLLVAMIGVILLSKKDTK